MKLNKNIRFLAILTPCLLSFVFYITPSFAAETQASCAKMPSEKCALKAVTECTYSKEKNKCFYNCYTTNSNKIRKEESCKEEKKNGCKWDSENEVPYCYNKNETTSSLEDNKDAHLQRASNNVGERCARGWDQYAQEQRFCKSKSGDCSNSDGRCTQSVGSDDSGAAKICIPVLSAPSACKENIKNTPASPVPAANAEIGA